MTPAIVPFAAESLTPFYYHGLYVPDGAATHPNVVSDTAICFALAQAIGLPRSPVLRDQPAYLEDLRRLPWRASLATGNGNRNLGPVRHIIDVEREGGNSVAMQKAMGSGMYKKTFYVHEVAPGTRYHGVLYGPDPFLLSDELVVRIGVGRLGLLRLCCDADERHYHLNTATAALFGQTLPEENRILDTLRLSQPYPLGEAVEILARWK